MPLQKKTEAEKALADAHKAARLKLTTWKKKVEAMGAEEIALCRIETKLQLKLHKAWKEILEEAIRPLVRFRQMVTRPDFNLTREQYVPWIKTSDEVLDLMLQRVAELELEMSYIEERLKMETTAYKVGSA